MRALAATLLLLPAGLVTTLPARATGEGEITTVAATVHNGYERARQPDGRPQPVRYAFGAGGFTGTPTKDTSVDELPFLKIAHAIAPGLARQDFLPSQDPEKTDQLIMVYWGATGADRRTAGGMGLGPAAIPPPPPPPKVIAIGRVRVYVPTNAAPTAPPTGSEQFAYDTMASFQNRERDHTNLRTAQLLGFEDAYLSAARQPEGRRYLDLVDELEDPRYFVILRAYDFRPLWKEKQQRLLWEVRYSIRARGHHFDESVGAMTELAARYCGTDSHGLVRREVPAGGVRLADPVFKEYFASPTKPE